MSQAKEEKSVAILSLYTVLYKRNNIWVAYFFLAKLKGTQILPQAATAFPSPVS